MKRIGVLALLLTLTGCDFLMDVVTPGGSLRVVSVTPTNNATDVAVGSRVVATLNLPNGGLDLTSVNDSSVRLVDAGTGTPVAATVTPDNDAETLTLAPTAPLAYSTTYRFELTSAVVDGDGQAVPEYSSTFTTVSSDKPSVASSEPADGETNVSVSVSIAAGVTNTDGGVDKTTLTSESVYLTEADGGTRIPGNAGSSGAGDTITFVPSQTLAANTRYQFNVTSAVTDISGAAFAPYTATFTTGSGSSEPLPTNISTIPQPTAARQRYSSLAVDPSGTYLYGVSVIGEVVRFPIASTVWWTPTAARA